MHSHAHSHSDVHAHSHETPGEENYAARRHPEASCWTSGRTSER